MGAAIVASVRWLWRRGFLSLVAFAIFVAPVYADDARIQVDQVRATDFPSVTARFTISGARGTPLPVLKSDNVVVEEDGQLISTVSVFPLFQNTVAPDPLALVIALDASGTMNESGKLAGAKEAAKTFISQLRPVDQVEIISFGDKVGVVVPFTHDRAALTRGIDNLTADGDAVFFDATYRAVSDSLRVKGTRFVVLITDGEDMASRSQLAPALDLARQSQVPIFTVGLGNNVSDDMLTRMASETNGRYFKAPRPDDLTAVFRLLAQDLASRYELTYFSRQAQEPGKQVHVTVRVSPSGSAPVERQFTYTMPAVKLNQPAPVDPGVLQPVVPFGPPAPPVESTPASTAPFTPEQAALFAFGAVLALLAGLALRLTRDPRDTRLATFVTGATRSVRGVGGETSGQLFGSLLGFLAGLASRVLPANQIQQLRQNLVLAGSPNGWGVEEFLGVRMLCAVGFAGVGYLYGLSRGPTGVLVGVVLMGLLGFLLPAIWLGRKIQARKKAIFRAMPNALDLISVSVEAGLGFDQAVAELCDKWHNELTREFALFLSEVQMGRDRREAMRGITERTGVPELNGFVSAVIQADELGSGIARTLTIQAEQARIRRRQYAEKLAHEAAIKMVFPLVFLIFPAIFVVILGPALPMIFQSLGHVGQ